MENQTNFIPFVSNEEEIAVQLNNKVLMYVFEFDHSAH